MSSFQPRDAHKFSPHIRTLKQQENWARIANKVMHTSADDRPRALRIANSVIAKQAKARKT